MRDKFLNRSNRSNLEDKSIKNVNINEKDYTKFLVELNKQAKNLNLSNLPSNFDT